MLTEPPLYKNEGVSKKMISIVVYINTYKFVALFDRSIFCWEHAHADGYVAGYKNKTGSRMQSLPQLWKEWEIRLMVLLSFVLQLFLLLAGSVHRRKVNGLHQLSLWLAYVGADAVAVFALGLISHYGENCGKLGIGNRSFGDTQPFLWIPFLLVHLGGQDSITAYSIEDNNLWLRHLLNLGIQGALALYIIWKSMYILDPQVLISTACMFLCGIIKYGERIWALKSASREGLTRAKPKPDGQNNYNPPTGNSNIYSYALQTVLHSRGLFVGRTLLQLGRETRRGFLFGFSAFPEPQVKLKIIKTELCLMFDLLYTKAVVLQSWAGCMCSVCCPVVHGSCLCALPLIPDEKRDGCCCEPRRLGQYPDQLCPILRGHLYGSMFGCHGNNITVDQGSPERGYLPALAFHQMLAPIS